MRTKSMPRWWTRLALGAALAGGGGCSLVGAAADGLVGGGPPSATPQPPPSPAAAGRALGDRAAVGPIPGTRGDLRRQAVTSGYLVAPALTWGALQLQRPHALTASLFDRGAFGWQTCRRIPRGMLGGPGVPSASSAEDLARDGPARLGVGGRVVSARTVLSLDREVVADRALRSGALLAQRGPLCLESLSLTLRLGHDDAEALHW